MIDNITNIRGVNFILSKKELSQSEIESFMSNYELIDFIINRTNKKTFRSIMSLLGNPEEIISRRNEIENAIIRNIDKLDSSFDRKEIFSEIILGDSSQNIALMLETILERLKTASDFSNKLEPNTLEVLTTIFNMLSSKDEAQQIEYFSKLSKESNLGELIDKMHTLAKKDFQKEVRTCIQNSLPITNISPMEIHTNNGIATNLYLLQAQTDFQRNFYMLSRTVSIRKWMLEENAYDTYLNLIKGSDYLSYSLDSEEINDGFNSKRSIKFGYFGDNPVLKNDLMSANTHDGQTNQYSLVDNFYVMRQQYSGIKEFVSQTEEYSEIVLKNDVAAKPDCIIINEYPPSEDIMLISHNMGIPLFYQDPNYYKHHQRANVLTDSVRMNSWYKHEQLLPFDLRELQNKNKSYT